MYKVNTVYIGLGNLSVTWLMPLTCDSYNHSIIPQTPALEMTKGNMTAR